MLATTFLSAVLFAQLAVSLSDGHEYGPAELTSRITVTISSTTTVIVDCCRTSASNSAAISTIPFGLLSSHPIDSYPSLSAVVSPPSLTQAIDISGSHSPSAILTYNLAPSPSATSSEDCNTSLNAKSGSVSAASQFSYPAQNVSRPGGTSTSTSNSTKASSKTSCSSKRASRASSAVGYYHSASRSMSSPESSAMKSGAATSASIGTVTSSSGPSSSSIRPGSTSSSAVPSSLAVSISTASSSHSSFIGSSSVSSSTTGSSARSSIISVLISTSSSAPITSIPASSTPVSSSVSTGTVTFSTIKNWNNQTFDKPAPTVYPSVKLPASPVQSNILASPTHHFQYGYENPDGSTFVLDATIEAAVQIVNGDSFVPFIESVDCQVSGMTIAFKDAVSYGLALTWPSQFAFVAPPLSNCFRADGGRQYYNVTSWQAGPSLFQIAITGSSGAMFDVCSRVKAQYGTVEATKNTTKRWSGDRSTSFNVDTNSFQRFISSDFLGDFNRGFKAGYNGVTDFDPSAFKFGDAEVSDNKVSCRDCGLSATITLFGGFDCTIFSCSTLYAGMDMQNLLVNTKFDIEGVKNYKADKTVVLEEMTLPGITIGGVLSVNPKARLQTEMKFALQDAGINIYNLGFQWKQTQTARLVLDIANNNVQHKGWNDIKPTPHPWLMITSVPSQFDFRGAFGPVFGVELSIGPLVSVMASYGLETPTIDVSIRRSSRDPSECTYFADGNAGANSNPPRNGTLDVSFDVGAGIWGEIDGHVLTKKWDSGELPIYDTPRYNILKQCWVMDQQMIDNTVWNAGTP